MAWLNRLKWPTRLAVLATLTSWFILVCITPLVSSPLAHIIHAVPIALVTLAEWRHRNLLRLDKDPRIGFFYLAAWLSPTILLSQAAFFLAFAIVGLFGHGIKPAATDSIIGIWSTMAAMTTACTGLIAIFAGAIHIAANTR